MGVAFSHCEASWSYSGFGYFRRELWKAAGFDGGLYALYETSGHEVAKDHPLFPLFNHSDCDGVLEPHELELIIPELERLCPKLSSWYDQQACLELIKGMKLAHSRAEHLQFH